MTSASVFGTDGVRGAVGGPRINAAFALHLGYATGRVLCAQGVSSATGRPQVLIGKDTRISGYMLESALQAGLSAAGVDVVLTGPLPTPAVAYLVRAQRMSAGIVISASHNPFPDNGIKIFSAEGMKLPDATEAAIDEALASPPGCVPSHQLGRARRLEDAAGRYIEFCKSTFPSTLDLHDMHIVVDAAHGAAFHIAADVLRELGAKVNAIGCEPDGFNINDRVGSMHPDTLISVVRGSGADLGIALDGDADRLIMVDGNGRLYEGDALLYAIVRERSTHSPVRGVAGTVMSNLGLERRFQAMGIDFARAAVGDRFVLECLQQRGWLYGGETSGHVICLDRHTTGDGMVAALQVLAALRRSGQTLTDWVGDLVLYPQHRLDVPLHPGMAWREHAGLQRAQTEIQGRLDGRGRLLIRASGTEPKLRLMVEAEDDALAASCVRYLADAIHGTA